jgi:soluble cytochrome b562
MWSFLSSGDFPSLIKWQPVVKDNMVQCDNKWQSAIKDNKVKFDKRGFSSLLETVDENKKFYTKHQFEQAKQARKLLYSLGYPSINDIKAIIQMNAIKNNPVTTEDVDIAEKIFGPDVASYLKRKDYSPCTSPHH